MIALPEGSVTKWEDDEDVGSLREANRKSANAKHGGGFREGLQDGRLCMDRHVRGGFGGLKLAA